MHQEKNIQKFIFGNAVFKFLPQKNQEKIKKQKKIQSILNQNSWSIDDEDYQKYDWQQIFSHMIECSTKIMYLGHNKRYQIISQIQYVRYANLKILALSQNNINNLQPLSFMHFQCLQQSFLNKNKISQIRCLKKLSIPSLNAISINQNPLIQINALIESKINAKKLKYLYLQYQSYQNQINQDLSALVKLLSESIQDLNVRSVKRINQVKVQSMLKLRFNDFYLQE